MSSTADLVTDSVPDLTVNHAKKETNKTFGKMTNKERIIFMKEVITVEPLIAAYVMASILCVPALYNLEYEKACRVNLNLNDTVCDSILYGEYTNFTAENDDIQIAISNMHSWQQPVQSIMPLILVLFLGSYSDRHQWRKPFLLLPIIGEFFAVAGCIFCVIFMRQWPLEVQGVMQTVVPSFFGGQTMIVMAAFSYIADVSSMEMRTLRVGIVQIVLNCCVPAVQSISGILFAQIGYIGILMIAAGLYLFAVIYGFFWIKEPKQPKKSSAKSLWADIFDPKLVIETFYVLLKKSPGNDRLSICMVLITLFAYTSVIVGETSLFFLFTQKLLQWTAVEYSYFLTINTLIHLIGTALAVPLFTKMLKLSDLTIILLTFLDKIISNIFFGLAQTATILYIAALVSIITGVTGVAIRSLATKIVSPNDLGKAQSLFGICEAVAPSISVPIYNQAIYINTLDYPSAFFWVGIGLYGVCCLIIIWMYFEQRKESQKEVKEIDAKVSTSEKPIQMDEIQTTHM